MSNIPELRFRTAGAVDTIRAMIRCQADYQAAPWLLSLITAIDRCLRRSSEAGDTVPEDDKNFAVFETGENSNS